MLLERHSPIFVLRRYFDQSKEFEEKNIRGITYLEPFEPDIWGNIPDRVYIQRCVNGLGEGWYNIDVNKLTGEAVLIPCAEPE